MSNQTTTTMKTTMITLMAGIILLATACKKYEDGPLISFRSKKERVANDWTMTNNPSGDNEYRFLFKDDETYLHEIIRDTVFYSERGTWSLQDKNELLVLVSENGVRVTEFEILRLKENELHLKLFTTLYELEPR